MLIPMTGRTNILLTSRGSNVLNVAYVSIGVTLIQKAIDCIGPIKLNL